MISCIIRLSLSLYIVPQSMKYAYITHILKKHNLNSSKLSNSCPVSKLSSHYKTMQRIVARQLIDYIISNSIVDCIPFRVHTFPIVVHKLHETLCLMILYYLWIITHLVMLIFLIFLVPLCYYINLTYITSIVFTESINLYIMKCYINIYPSNMLPLNALL